MAGRFSHLEFEHRQPGALAETTQEVSEAPGAQHYLARALDADRWGESELALRFFTRSLQEDRTVIAAWTGQVQMLVQLGEYHEARVWSDKALDLFRNNGELLAAKAQACIRLKDKKTAQECADGSLQVPGSSPWRWQVRGEILLANRKNHSEECFRKALAEPAADWFDRVVVARIYSFYDRTTNALQYLKRALELESANGYVWYEIGNCERSLGLNEAAEQSYQRCLELRPDYGPASAAIDALAPASPLVWLRGLLRRWSRR